MTPAARELLGRHVAFELKRWKGRSLQAFLKHETRHFLRHARRISLEQLLERDAFESFLRTVLLESRLDATALALAGDFTASLVAALRASPDAIEKAFNEDEVRELLRSVLRLDGQRERVVSAALHHPVYQDLVSQLVYHAIVSYLTEDNPLAQRVPGMNSMVRLGRKIASRAGIDSAVEKQVRQFIRQLLPALMERSERYVLETLTPEELEEALVNLWTEAASQPAERFVEGMHPSLLLRLLHNGSDIWLTFRSSRLAQILVDQAVQWIYDEFGQQPLERLLDAVGIDDSFIVAQAQQLVPAAVNALRETGYLEQVLRRRLEPFYASREIGEYLQTL